jgi:hypothetical protein
LAGAAIQLEIWNFSHQKIVNLRLAIGLCLGIPLAAFVAGRVIHDSFQDRLAAAVAQHQQETNRWGDEALIRDNAVKQQALERANAEAKQLTEALGGPVGAAWKNPDLSIAQMLEATAKAIAPPRTEVQVQVDRFTEFDLALTLPVEAHPSIAELCLGVLRHGGPYLSTVRITQGDEVLADLDDRAIASVPDWSKATARQMREVLESSKSSTFTETTTSLPQPGTVKTDEGNETDDSRGEKVALEAFNTARRNQVDALNSALAAQNAAINLRDASTVNNLQTKLNGLGANESVLADVHEFLLNEDKEFRRLLEQQQVDSLLVDILVRKQTQRQDERRRYLKPLFQAINERQRVTSDFLGEMMRLFGTWSTEPTKNIIRFTSEETREIYQRFDDKLGIANKQLSAALSAWQKWEDDQESKL